MKVVINTCFGGFGLSPLATQEIAERKGRKCYFFLCNIGERGKFTYTPTEPEDIRRGFLLWYAFDIPDITELDINADWAAMTHDERTAHSERYAKHSLDFNRLPRTDSDLIAVVEELGDKAYGAHAELKVVEIPDDVDWDIDEYDGVETIHEVHRSWS